MGRMGISKKYGGRLLKAPACRGYTPTDEVCPHPATLPARPVKNVRLNMKRHILSESNRRVSSRTPFSQKRREPQVCFESIASFSMLGRAALFATCRPCLVNSLTLGLGLVVAGMASHSAQAATITHNNTNGALATASSWVGGVAPTTADTMLFDSTITSSLSMAAPSAVFGGPIQITGIGGNLTFSQSSGQTWTLTGGIDMSAAAADLTIGTSGAFLRIATAITPTFNVASGRTLTINSTLNNQGNTKTFNFTGPGNIILNGTGNGGGGATSFSVNGGANLTLNGTGSWSGTTANVIVGTLNIGNDTALNALTLNIGGTNANTPTVTAVGGARTITNNVALLATSLGGNPTISGSNALTLNGTVTNSGANRTLSVNNSALTTLGGTVNLSESASNRTLTINGSGNALISGVVANGSTSTASALTYSGSGTLTLSNTNTYAGATTFKIPTLMGLQKLQKGLLFLL